MAAALEIHKCGGYIAVLDIQDVPERAQHILGSRASFFKCDLTKTEEIEQAVKQAVNWSREVNAKLGGVINCGGVAVAQKAGRCPTVRNKWTNVAADHHREGCTALVGSL